MRRAISLVSILALCLSGVALAGFNPSPFKREINKLRAVENSLMAAYHHIDHVLGRPPDPYLPTPALVNQFEALAFLLAKKEARIMMVVEPVLIDPALGIPPDPMRPALESLATVGGVIFWRVDEGMGTLPDDQRVMGALDLLLQQAEDLLATVDGYLIARSPGS